VCIILAHWLKTTPAQLTTRGNGVPQNAHMRRRNQLGHGWWSVGHAGAATLGVGLSHTPPTRETVMTASRQVHDPQGDGPMMIVATSFDLCAYDADVDLLSARVRTARALMHATLVVYGVVPWAAASPLQPCDEVCGSTPPNTPCLFKAATAASHSRQMVEGVGADAAIEALVDQGDVDLQRAVHDTLGSARLAELVLRCARLLVSADMPSEVERRHALDAVKMVLRVATNNEQFQVTSCAEYSALGGAPEDDTPPWLRSAEEILRARVNPSGAVIAEKDLEPTAWSPRTRVHQKVKDTCIDHGGSVMP